LNIKSTHGYEIQKFIQLNQMDEWTKIQSGSIYYALNKLEKEKLIEIEREEESGGKTRKIYSITSDGKEALEDILLEELRKPIQSTQSDKFVTYPFFKDIPKERLIAQVRGHIAELEKEKLKHEQWAAIKGGDGALGIVQVSFEMMISSLSYQIKWHEALLEELDRCIGESEEVARLIKGVDFSEVKDVTSLFDKTESIDVKRIKESILENPNQAEDILSKLIKDIKK